MDAALYEKLTGFYSDGLLIDDLPGSFQLVHNEPPPRPERRLGDVLIG